MKYAIALVLVGCGGAGFSSGENPGDGGPSPDGGGYTIVHQGTGGQADATPDDAGTGGGPSTGGASSGGVTGAAGGGSPSTGGASGGVTGTGGHPATGGAPAAGGAPATGGAPAAGGAPASGGAPATGGTTGTGGTPSTCIFGGQNSFCQGGSKAVFSCPDGIPPETACTEIDFNPHAFCCPKQSYP